MKLWKSFYFESAHCLPDYEGKCKNLHGHQWRLDIGIGGAIQKEGSYKGMIIDFSELKKIMNPLIEKLDHKYLNDLIEYPTAENMMDYIVKEITYILPDPYYLCGLKLYESPDSYIEWSNP